jgi:hypothetical protein
MRSPYNKYSEGEILSTEKILRIARVERQKKDDMRNLDEDTIEFKSDSYEMYIDQLQSTKEIGA